MCFKNGMTLLAVLAALTLAGCGGKSDAPSAPPAASGCGSNQLGSFTGSASGTAAGSLSGCAMFTVGEFDNGTWWSLALTNGTPETASPLVGLNGMGGRPAPGTYVLGTDELGGGILIRPGDRFFIVSNGSLTITASSASSIAGSVTLSATEVGTSNTMTITGNFNAVCHVDPSDSNAFPC